MSGMGALVADHHRSRTCVRCGRTGSNAFRPIVTDPGHVNWLCMHEQPCVARMRIRHRSVARASAGRPPTSPIATAHLSERPTCVIGSNRRSVETLAGLLEELTAAEVDRLDLSRRGLDLVGRRDYGLVLLDTQPDDPVACMNQLARTLSSARRRDCAVVVRHASDDPRPTLEQLLHLTSATAVEGTVDADRIMGAVQQATEGIEVVRTAS